MPKQLPSFLRPALLAVFLAAIALVSPARLAATMAPDPAAALWSESVPLPPAAELPRLSGVRFEVIQPLAPERDGYHWLHGVAVAWHRGRLYASFGHNRGAENTAGEQARGRVSHDDGRTWGEIFSIEDGTGHIGVSHGAFLSHGGVLWAFHGAFSNRRQEVHTRAYVLDEATGSWAPRGQVIGDGFWPLQEPIRMEDGNWIMGGTRLLGQVAPYRNPPAVAISRGDDFTQWEVITVEPDPDAPGNIWGEANVFVRGAEVTIIGRYGHEAVALVGRSRDFGRTWTKAVRSNLPMATSKPCAGTLSTGQHYLIGTTAADNDRRRYPLTIAVTRPGETQFSHLFVIRDAVQEGPGESHPAARLSYPYATEHDGHLYVGYSNAGSRGGNRNSAELAIIPLGSIAVP